MASDVLFDEYTSEDLDFNGEIFLKVGTMNPKELYLTDLTHCQDTTSSDSGISTLDDLHDVANITDLNSVLESDFKDLDFSLGFLSPKIEQDDIFDPADAVVKIEPNSPPAFNEHEILADLFFNDDVIDEVSPCTAPSSHLVDPSSPASWTYSPEQPTTISSYVGSSSPTQLWSPSSPAQLLNSQSLQGSPTYPSHPEVLPSISQQLSSDFQDTAFNGCLSDSSQFTITPPSSPPNIIVLPSIKQEKQISILPCPGGRLVSFGGGATPISANIDSILNSKIRIQPKPGSEIIVPKAGSCQWITTTANSQIHLPSQQPGPIITASSLMSCTNTVTDEKTFKRAQRIIKNRESASLSRKRKKEYMTSLEERLQQCRHENERLLKENETLKQQLQQLQRENTGLKHPSLSPAKKVCLMCLVFLLTLNLSPFSFLSGPSSLSVSSGGGANHHASGRHLMSLPDDSSSRTAEYASDLGDLWSSDMLMQLDEELNLLAEKLNITGKLGNMCPMYFNSTESNRLAEQLRGWMISQEEEKKKTEISRQKKKKDYPPLRHFGDSQNSKNKPSVTDNKFSAAASENSYPVQVFSGGYGPSQLLLNAIPRRNDTFYVLSFSTDYFLVPATAHNKTMRPRMSLLMPVVTSSINRSTGQGPDSVGMMQIDCEIFSTNIINIHRSAFPQETRFNFTSYERNESNRSRSEEGIKNGRSKEGGRNSTERPHDHKYWEKLKKTQG